MAKVTVTPAFVILSPTTEGDRIALEVDSEHLKIESFYQKDEVLDSGYLYFKKLVRTLFVGRGADHTNCQLN